MQGVEGSEQFREFMSSGTERRGEGGEVRARKTKEGKEKEKKERERQGRMKK